MKLLFWARQQFQGLKNQRIKIYLHYCTHVFYLYLLIVSLIIFNTTKWVRFKVRLSNLI